MEDTKTFIANIRCDFRYIAKIAKFIASEGRFVGTKSKIASEAIRILAHSIPDEFNSEEYGEAVIALRTLGYKDELIDNSGYYRELNNRISLERNQKTSEVSIEETTAKLVKKHNEKHFSNTSVVDKTALKSVIAPVEDEVESPQLKIRTSEDERADISKIRTAMNVSDGAPIEVLEENKPTPRHSEHPEQTQSPE